MLSQDRYIICNAATKAGKQVAGMLLKHNCHVILAGPNYSLLSALEKELNEESRNLEVALLEPSKEIDWQNLSESLKGRSLSGIIHIHELKSENKDFFETSYVQFSAIIDDQLWGTYLSAKILTRLFSAEQKGNMIHLLDAHKHSLHYPMINRALESLIETIQQELQQENINVKYIELRDESVEDLLSAHILN